MLRTPPNDFGHVFGRIGLRDSEGLSMPFPAPISEERRNGIAIGRRDDASREAGLECVQKHFRNLTSHGSRAPMLTRHGRRVCPISMAIPLTATIKIEAMSTIPAEQSFKVAVVQAAPVYLDAEATIAKSLDLIRQAADAGARLIVFPELWCPGYPWWVWLGGPAWGAQFLPRYVKSALERGGRELEAISAAAARYRIHVSFGFCEREGGSLYIAQALFASDGRLLQLRRKLKPARTERAIFGQGGGADLRAVDSALGRIGSLCCGEHYQILLKAGMMSQQEHLHIAAWPSFSLLRGRAFRTGPEAALLASRAYALEAQCFVLVATMVADDTMLSIVCDTEERRSMMTLPGMERCGGCSMIYSPDGEALAAPLPESEEGIVVAEVNLSHIAPAKISSDAFGHWARPDVVRLQLNLESYPLEDAPGSGFQVD